MYFLIFRHLPVSARPRFLVAQVLGCHPEGGKLPGGDQSNVMHHVYLLRCFQVTPPPQTPACLETMKERDLSRKIF